MRIFNSQITLEPCKKCDGSMYVKDKYGDILTDDIGKDIRCACFLANKYLEANIGYDYWDIEVDNWTGDKKDLAKITKYFDKIDLLKEQGRGFFIYGSYGTGKTSEAILLLKHVIRTTHYSALFVPFSELVILNSKVMTGWHDLNTEKAIEQIKNIDFLVLDDLAKEFDNERDNGRATLNAILRYRDLWRKPTVYTSNIALDQIAGKYGASTLSIISGRSTIIDMVNEFDYRIQRKIQQELSEEEGK